MTRLVIFVDIAGHAASKTQMDVSARLETEASDVGRIVLLDDRGWASSTSHPSETIPDIWIHHSLDDIRETARMVVGPDEPFGDRSQEDMTAEHWGSLAKLLRRHRIDVDAVELQHLPHDVVPSERLLARIGHPSPNSTPS